MYNMRNVRVRAKKMLIATYYVCIMAGIIVQRKMFAAHASAFVCVCHTGLCSW